MQFLSEEDLEKSILHAPIGICILNTDSFIVELVNNKFLEVTGKPNDAIYGKAYWDVFGQLRSSFEQPLQNLVKTGEPYYADEVDMVMMREGRPQNIVVTFAYMPIKNAQGAVSKIAVWILENTRQVAERKKESAAKRAFEVERDRFKNFLLQAAAGISIMSGPDLVYELVNPAYQEILHGRNLMGRPLFEAVPELVGTPLQEQLLRVYQKGETLEVNELLVPISDYEGGPTQDRYFSFTYQPWRDDTDKIEGILGIVFEVTGMIKVQQQLAAARALADQQKRVYETITSGTPDLMYVWDLQYRFTYANKALLQMWGKTWDTAIGVGLRENGYEEWHAAMHEREIDDVVRTKKPVRGEVSFPHAELGKRIYDYILIPVLGEDGEVVAVAGTTRDVTERKSLEEAIAKSSEELQVTNEQLAAINEEQAASNEELTAANDALSEANEQLTAARYQIDESQNMLRLAIETASIGTWYINQQTGEFITDTRSKELFGFYPGEYMSIKQALAQITEDYRPYVSAQLDRAMHRGGDYDVTYMVTGLHDGAQRWLRAIGNHTKDAAGNLVAFTGVVMDVTQQRLDEQRKNDFIAMVSHELKTPLTSMKGYLQLLQEQLKTYPDFFVPMALEQANKQVVKMTTMINGFLNVSRLESGKMRIEPERFDMAVLFKEVQSDSLATIVSHPLFFAPVDEAWVMADRDKIGHVIDNLISNAVKYSPAGTPINISCITAGNHVQVCVADRGMGIAEEELPKLFERYYRSNTGNNPMVSGFGIGLYLCYEIIQHHGGNIWATSEPGKGSQFYFELPLIHG
ncbi:MAG: PAS domain-containing protein [Chitinophagaceae bacterium]